MDDKTADSAAPIEANDQDRQNFEEIVQHDDYYTKLDAPDQELIDFLVKHLNLVLKVVFENLTQSPKLICKCKAFLQSRDEGVHNRLMNETNLIEYLTKYPKEFSHVHHKVRDTYINILSQFLFDDDQNILKNVGTVQLFENLVSVCDFNTSFAFICSLIMLDNREFIYLFNDVKFPDIVAKYITGDTQLNFNAQKLIELLIDKNNVSIVSDSLTKDALITSFICYSFERLNVHQNFAFILRLYKYSVRHSLISNWKTIEIAIASRYDDFRTIVANTKQWNETANISLHILIDIISHRKTFNEKDQIFFINLIGKFFSMPVCSILHITTLRALRILNEIHKLDSITVQKSEIIQKIIENYKKRDEIEGEVNYWGALREMADIVGPFVTGATEKSAWEEIVIAKNKKICEVIGIEKGIVSKSLFKQVRAIDIMLVFVYIIVAAIVVYFFYLKE